MQRWAPLLENMVRRAGLAGKRGATIGGGTCEGLPASEAAVGPNSEKKKDHFVSGVGGVPIGVGGGFFFNHFGFF